MRAGTELHGEPEMYCVHGNVVYGVYRVDPEMTVT